MAVFPNYIPDSDSKYQREPRILSAGFGDGYSQEVGDGLNPYTERWDLRFGNRPKSDVAIIRAFLDTQNGATPFDWTPPDEVAVKKWRMRGGYSISNAERDMRTISFSIERYFGP